MSERKWWSKEKIAWYERASDLSSFHSTLSAAMEKYIPKENKILEIGCGTGRIAEALYKKGYSILALDKDEDAIETAERRSGLPIFRIGDYKETKETGDTLLTVFFGRFWISDNLSSLLSLSRKNMVTVHSLHIGQGIRGKETPSLSLSLEYLEKRGYFPQGEEVEIPFHQPLLSYEEGLDFIRSSYGEDKLSLYASAIEESGNKDYPFIFRNNKKLVMINIERK